MTMMPVDKATCGSINQYVVQYTYCGAQVLVSKWWYEHDARYVQH